MNALKDVDNLYTIADPSGNLVHTHICTMPHEVIESWLDEERVIRGVLMGRVTPSWEHYEAEGYRVTRIALVHRPNELYP